jgi:hypothetical protein
LLDRGRLLHLRGDAARPSHRRFLGLEPSNRPIVQPLVVMITFRDGLMASERFPYDLASLLRQIGPDPIPALTGLDDRQAA